MPSNDALNRNELSSDKLVGVPVGAAGVRVCVWVCVEEEEQEEEQVEVDIDCSAVGGSRNKGCFTAEALAVLSDVTSSPFACVCVYVCVCM